MMRVLVLDADQRNALAIVRSLGRHGITILTADSGRYSLAGSSRYTSKHLQLPSTYNSAEQFIIVLTQLVEQEAIDILLPLSDVTIPIILKARERLGKVKIPLPDKVAYEQMTDKYQLFQRAQEMGLSIPKTYFVNNRDELIAILNKIEFPVVIKPSRSRVLIANTWHHTSVTYARSKDELLVVVQNYRWFPQYPLLLQEFIQGHGCGISTLYDQGSAIGWFQHKRVREKPPDGGVSVLCESEVVDPAMQAIAERLLNAVAWHGVAMVEFKRTAEGKSYLVEINGRFWGSLQLAIDAGMDFPWLLIQLATGARFNVRQQYFSGVRSRWLLGDLDRLYLIFKNRHGRYTWRQIAGEVITFMTLFSRNTRYDVNRWSDPIPFVYELYHYIRALIRSDRH